jgi:hypothetical protein
MKMLKKNSHNILYLWEYKKAFLKAYDNDVNYYNDDYQKQKAGRSINNLPAKMILHHRHPVIPGRLLASRAYVCFAGLYNIREMINIGKHHLRSLAYQSLKNARCQMAL